MNDTHLLAIGINTTRPRRHKDGEISAGQVARVGRCQAEDRDIVAAAGGGHTPARRGDRPVPDVANLIHGRTEAIAAWADAG